MSSTQLTQPAPPSASGARRLTFRNFLGYGAGDMANNLSFSLVLTFLPLYLTDVALISPATVASIFLIMRFIDAFTDLLIGAAVDRTKTRWGKFRPYILVFSVPLAIVAVLVFSMPRSLYGTSGAVVWASVTYFLLASVFFTLVNVPYGSLAAAMTQDNDERAKLATFRSVGAAIMQVITALAISPAIRANQGDPEALQRSLTITVTLLAVIAVALHVFLYLTTFEQVERPNSKVRFADAVRTLAGNRALLHLCLAAALFLTALFTQIGLIAYYVRDVYGDIGYTPVALTLIYGMVILLGPFVPKLIGTFGKRSVFVVSTLSGAVGGVVLYFAASGATVVVTFGFFLLGICSGVCNLLMWNLEADTIDYGEWKRHERTEGTTYAVFSFTRKMGQSIGGAVGLWIIGMFGYVGGISEQSPEAIEGIRIATGLVPAALFVVTAIVMTRYPLTEKVLKSVVEELKERHTSRAESPGLNRPAS